MKTNLTSIPKHYRRLGKDEIAKCNDLCFEVGDPTIYRCDAYWRVSSYPDFKFFRRQHVKVRDNVTKHPVQLPLVEFSYPRKGYYGQTTIRSIRMIACNWYYVIGLDIHDNFQFKRFARSKIVNGIRVMEFNSSAIK
jgi:hypothetical protein